MGTPILWGSEFLVNTATQGGQDYPTVAALANGGFVVTWGDYGGTAGSASGIDVRAQVFDADGTPRGAEFLVNTTLASTQHEPAVTGLADGRFVVTWTDNSGTGADASGSAVRAQVFSANGTPQGAEFVVNATTASNQHKPAVTALAHGGFVVTWTDNSGTGADASNSAIRAQVFSADGTPHGAERLVNTTTVSTQNEPAVTALADGGFVVTWSDNSGTGGDASGNAVRAQVFSADGTPVGPERLVNTTVRGHQYDSAVTALASGGFVVTWADESGFGTAAAADVRGQVFGADGLPVGSELVISAAAGDQLHPATTALADGRFALTWTDYSATGGDTSRAAVRLQVFEANGAPSGSVLLVNTTTNSHQDAPTVAALADGRIVVTWADNSQTGGDTSGYGVRAQILDPREAAVTVTGTGGADHYVGTGFADELAGSGGDDRLTGGDGDDGLYGGTGHDKLSGGQGNDALYGDDDHDTLSGDDGNDDLGGGEGNDTVEGGAGSDTLNGGTGDDRLLYGTGTGSATGGDTVYGGDGNDLIDDGLLAISTTSNDELYGGGGDDRVGAGGGDDSVYGDVGDDQLAGEAGQDTLHGQDGNDRILGQDGNDKAYGGIGDDQVDGGAGDDEAHGDAGDDQVEGGTGNDVLLGQDGSDSLGGGEGDDQAYGGAGHDQLDGGGGHDIVAGDDGHDRIFGQDGNDVADGGAGDDTLLGGQGDDALTDWTGDNVLDGGLGNDSLQGGDGDDILHGGDGDDTLADYAGHNTLDGGDGNDTAEGGAGNDTLMGGEGHDRLGDWGGSNFLDGGAGDDTIQGGGGDDALAGGDGDDTLSDWGGNNTLYGGAGNDSLWADVGSNHLRGGVGDDAIATGSGADVVVLDVGGGHDVVTDFDLGDADGDGRTNDQIDAKRLTDADGTAVTARDVVVTDDGQGNARLTFPGGETLVLQGVSPAQLSGGVKKQVLQFADANAAPVASPGQGTGQGTGPEDTVITGQVGATDADEDALTYSLVQDARDANGHAVAGLTFNADGSYSFQGPRDFHGTVTFTYTASDATAASSEAIVTLTVTPVNDAPRAPNLLGRTSAEDHSLSFTVPAFADVDTDTLTYAATLADGAPLPAWLAFDASTRTFSGTPPADRSGPLGLMVTASDGVTSASDTFTLTINPVNDAPVAAAILDHTSPEDGRVSFQVPVFADVDGDTLTYTATLADGAVLPAWLSFDAATRSFSGTPPANWSGALDVKISASDGAALAPSTFRLSITPVNDGPVAQDDRLSATEGAVLRIPVADLLDNDRDVDGDVLTITGVSHAQGGTAVLRDGVVTFTPQANVSGPAFFDYTVRDGAGRTDVARVAINVAPVNDAPVNDAPVAPAIPDRAFLEDGAVRVQVPAFADVDGDALAYAATLASGGALPVWLTFDAATRTFAGQPPANWSGALDLAVTASDGRATASDTFRLSLTPVSDAPVAGADTLGGPSQAPIHDGAPARIDVTALLANDLDPDGGPVRFAGIAAGPGKGTLDTVTEGGRTYLLYEYAGAQLGAGATAGDAFTYRVVDASGATATATASLTVTGLPTRTINGTAKSETLTGGDLVHDVIHGKDGDDVVQGGAGHDRLSGGKGADRLAGGEGADQLNGERGHDRLNGGTGRDWLNGERGADRLTGGAGADVFVFGQGAGQDRIADFDLGADDIRLGEGVSVVSAVTGHLDDDRQLDTTLSLSNGGTVEVMDVAGLSANQWALIA